MGKKSNSNLKLIGAGLVGAGLGAGLVGWRANNAINSYKKNLMHEYLMYIIINRREFLRKYKYLKKFFEYQKLLKNEKIFKIFEKADSFYSQLLKFDYKKYDKYSSDNYDEVVDIKYNMEYGNRFIDYFVKLFPGYNFQHNDIKTLYHRNLPFYNPVLVNEEMLSKILKLYENPFSFGKKLIKRLRKRLRTSSNKRRKSSRKLQRKRISNKYRKSRKLKK